MTDPRALIDDLLEYAVRFAELNEEPASGACWDAIDAARQYLADTSPAATPLPACGRFMAWVDHLSEVGDPILAARDRLRRSLDRAESLERQAAAVRAEVAEGRAALLRRVLDHWTVADIEAASIAAGEAGSPFPAAYVSDAELREALRALDGAASPLEILGAFHKGRVIRQHNLFGTATEAEHRATLHRVFDWWNYGAVPLLVRLQG